MLMQCDYHLVEVLSRLLKGFVTAPTDMIPDVFLLLEVSVKPVLHPVKVSL